MLIQVGPRNHILDGGPESLTGRGTFEGGHVPARWYVPMHECIKPAAGDCACPAHAANECFRRRDNTAMRTFAKSHGGHLFQLARPLVTTLNVHGTSDWYLVKSMMQITAAEQREYWGDCAYVASVTGALSRGHSQKSVYFCPKHITHFLITTKHKTHGGGFDYVRTFFLARYDLDCVKSAVKL